MSFSTTAALVVGVFALAIYFSVKIRRFLKSKRDAAVAEFKLIAQKASEDLKKL